MRVRRRERRAQRERVAHAHAPGGLLGDLPAPLELADESFFVQRHLHVSPVSRLGHGELTRERAAEHQEPPPAALLHEQPPVVHRVHGRGVHRGEYARRREVVREHGVHGIRVARQNHLPHQRKLPALVGHQLAGWRLEEHAGGGRRVVGGSARAREGSARASSAASVRAADASSARSRGEAAPTRRRGRRRASRRRVVPISDARVREMRRCESCRRRHRLSRAHASCPNPTPRSQARGTRDIQSRVTCLV